MRVEMTLSLQTRKDVDDPKYEITPIIKPVFKLLRSAALPAPCSCCHVPWRIPSAWPFFFYAARDYIVSVRRYQIVALESDYSPGGELEASPYKPVAGSTPADRGAQAAATLQFEDIGAGAAWA
jgi:hypothetical protein